MKQDSSKNANRIHILDIIRGIAVLGIFTMNLPLMAFPDNLSDNYLYTDPDRGWGYWIGITSDIIFLDKMRGLFTVLFGVSSVLIKKNWRRTQVAWRLLIFILGVYLGYLLLV